jgi:hypothetical protein
MPILVVGLAFKRCRLAGLRLGSAYASAIDVYLRQLMPILGKNSGQAAGLRLGSVPRLSSNFLKSFISGLTTQRSQSAQSKATSPICPTRPTWGVHQVTADSPNKGLDQSNWYWVVPTGTTRYNLYHLVQPGTTRYNLYHQVLLTE